jgi:rRNA maturation protein Rpf1
MPFICSTISRKHKLLASAMNLIETCMKYCYEGRGKPEIIYVIMLKKYDEKMSWNCLVNIRLNSESKKNKVLLKHDSLGRVLSTTC